MTSNAKPGPPVPTVEEIRAKVQEVFSRRACLWQCTAIQATLSGKHVCIDVGTGMGKTLAFLAPATLDPEKILFIVSPLNVLGSQNQQYLENAGIAYVRRKHRAISAILNGAVGQEGYDDRRKAGVVQVQ